MVTLSRQDALDFYHRWYAPNNAILIIAGDVTAAEVRPLAEKIYGPIPARSLPPRLRLTEPTTFAPRQLVLRSADVHQTFWQRIYLAPSYRNPPASTAYGLEVLAELLAGGVNSRLYKDLVIAKGIATEVAADYDASLRDYGRFSVTAMPPVGGDMAKLGRTIDADIADLLAKGVSDSEVAAAKGRLQADAVKARDGLMGPARLMGISLSVGLSLDEVQNWSDRIATVTPADVMAAARRVFRIDTSVTGELQAEAQP
jgi:zinc protease